MLRWFLVFAAASLLGAQSTPAGHWEATFNADGREIGLSLDLAQKDAGWIASMGMPAENVTGLVVKDLAVNGKSVKFMSVELMMSTFDLKLGEDGKLTGTLVNPRSSSLPIEFHRTGEAKVQLPPTSPAVSKELEGDWAGALKTPGSEVEVTIHFKNLPDGTVSATIDVPATKSVGMPIDSVKQSGDKVQFGLKIAHGAFQGTLKGNELTGELGHDGQGMPMVLRKK
jgi:hypothetical protein